MPAPKDHGGEIARYLSPTGRLCSVCADGTTLAKTIFNRDGQVWRRKKPGVPLEQWRTAVETKLAELPRWRRKVRSLPTERDLEEWASDSVCETPTGELVEPDGHASDGSPSWLLALGLI